MQKNPIGWVEIPVTDLDRAEDFYSNFFGFEMKRQPEKNGVTMSFFPMEDDGYGASGGLSHGEGMVPTGGGTIPYFTAPEGSVEQALEKAGEYDVRIIIPRTDIGEHGFFAQIEDSEGNTIAIHSMDG